MLLAIELYDQPIIVAADIENDLSVLDHIRSIEKGNDLIGVFELGIFHNTVKGP